MTASPRRALALLLALGFAQSCVLESLDANRGPEGSAASAGEFMGRAGSATGGTLSNAGTASLAGKPSGGSGGMSSGGVNNTSGSGGQPGGAEAGAGGEPAVDWVLCDPTFAYSGAFVECSALEPRAGDFCDSDLFTPEDYCTYCENARQCQVDTDYVSYHCVNRAWRVGETIGIGCCPDAQPTHGAACQNSPACAYGAEECDCIDSQWQCCADAFDGAACTEPGKQCIVRYSLDEIERCECSGALWKCCPSVAPQTGDVCYVENGTICAYPGRTCTCASFGGQWSCN